MAFSMSSWRLIGDLPHAFNVQRSEFNVDTRALEEQSHVEHQASGNVERRPASKAIMVHLITDCVRIRAQYNLEHG
jgi:hypothetical protein